MSRLRQSLRFAHLLLHVLGGVARIRYALWQDRRQGTGAARRAQVRWCERLCEIAGIRVRLEGEPLSDGPVLVAANHISWLDIPCLARFWELAFLSKSEVGGWPLIGPVATGLGTLYIGRGGGAAEAIAVMGERLRQGRQVLFFPEGTTGAGHDLLPLRPRLFQAAVDAGVPVQPLVLRFFDADGEPSRLAPFIGDQPLLDHLWQLCRSGPIEARLWVGSPIPVEGAGRTELARRCREAMLAGFDRFG